MESPASRPGFSLDALIAEAKRRARQRRLLIAVLLLAVAAVAAAVVFGSSGGPGSRQGGSAGGLGSGSANSHSLQIGAFALTVPRGFYQEKIPCPIRHCRLGNSPIRVLVSNHPLTAASSPETAANRVVLDLGYMSPAGFLHTQRLPLTLHKLTLIPGQPRSGFVAADGSVYQVLVFEGHKAPPSARASVLRALGSIRRAR
jgi:hypothetical protein